MGETVKWQNRITGYGVEDADQLLANPQNWRIHPKFQQDSLTGVLDSVGWVQNVIVNQRTSEAWGQDRNIETVVDGHLRIALAISRHESVPVTYVDLDPNEEALILASIDPIAALAATDKDQLDALLKSVNSDSEAVQQLLASVAESAGLYKDQPPGAPEAQLNRAEELRKKYNVERGQLWSFGKHKLLCGDSYSLDDIHRLTDGHTVDMLHTDPPYGINIVKPRAGGSAADSGGAKPFGSSASSERKGKSAVAFRNSGKVGGGRGDEASHHAHRHAEHGHVQHGAPSKNQVIQSNLYPVIEGDDTPFDPVPFLTIAPITILWGANYYADKLPISSCWICWDKREDITRNNFADCELAWCNLDKPSRLFHHLWNGLHKGSQNGQRRIHPTEKPVALFEEIGNMFSQGGVWLDLFAGSGAQIVAAERSGATCLALEYEPLYVACVIDRLEQMDLTPRLVE